MPGPNNDTASFFLRQELMRAAALVSNARSRVVQAKSIRDLRAAMSVPFSPYVRPVRHTVSGYRSLQTDADRRAWVIVEEALKQMEARLKAADSDDALRKVEAAMTGARREWQAFGPDFQLAVAFGLKGLDRLWRELRARPAVGTDSSDGANADAASQENKE